MKSVTDLKDGGLCPVCQRGLLRRQTEPTPYAYKGDTITVDVDGFLCDVCEETYLTHAQLRRLEPLLSDQRRRVDGLLTSAEIRQIRTRLGVSQELLSEVLGGGPKAFARYENGTVVQSQAMDNLLRLLQEYPAAFDTLRKVRRTGPTVSPARRRQRPSTASTA